MRGRKRKNEYDVYQADTAEEDLEWVDLRTWDELIR